jgi:excisionase family DNA binding protein
MINYAVNLVLWHTHEPLRIGVKSMNAAIPKLSPLEPLIDKRTTAARLGVSVRTVENLVADGKLRAVKINTAVRFDPADVQSFIEMAKSN